MRTTLFKRTGRTVALAGMLLSLAAGALTLHAGDAHAANMPDWAADFLAGGDAFEGGGGGGGGAWRPSPLNPGTGSNGGGSVPTTCTSSPTSTGEEMVCTPSYPATSLPPARSTPDYRVTTGSGGKGLGDRDERWLDPVRDLEGERLVAEWERLVSEYINTRDKTEQARLLVELKRVFDKLEARGWRYQSDPTKPDYEVWYPPFLCC